MVIWCGWFAADVGNALGTDCASAGGETAVATLDGRARGTGFGGGGCWLGLVTGAGIAGRDGGVCDNGTGTGSAVGRGGSGTGGGGSGMASCSVCGGGRCTGGSGTGGDSCTGGANSDATSGAIGRLGGASAVAGANTNVTGSDTGWLGGNIRRAIMTDAITPQTCKAIEPSSDHPIRVAFWALPAPGNRGTGDPSNGQSTQPRGSPLDRNPVTLYRII
jgi:hypothetical protein